MFYGKDAAYLSLRALMIENGNIAASLSDEKETEVLATGKSSTSVEDAIDDLKKNLLEEFARRNPLASWH